MTSVQYPTLSLPSKFCPRLYQALCRTASDSSSINVGDIVRIKSGSKTYDGSSVDDWVYFKRFYVSSVNGKRVVLNKSPDSTVLAINTAFNIKDLKKV